jgi:signal transduction histidine kinase
MKSLTTHVQKQYVFLSIFLLFGTLLLFVYIISNYYDEEADEHNRFLKYEIIRRYDELANKGLSDSTIIFAFNQYIPFCEVHVVEHAHPDSLYTIESVSPDGSEESELFRCLKTSFERHSKVYSITLQSNTEHPHDALFPLLLISALYMTGLLLGFFYLNVYNSKRLWKPFHLILHTIRNFKSDTKVQYQDIQTDIHEFAELDASIRELMRKVTSDFEKQKKFIETTAHELQTPITVLRLKTEKLLQCADNNPELNNKLTELDTQLSKLTLLVRNLLFLSKIENDQYLDKEDVVVSNVWYEITHNLADYASVKEIELRYTSEASVTVCCNKTLAVSLFQNLLINAIHYSDSGSTVVITLNPSGLEICNPGNTALPEELLYKRFFTSGSGGTGLGLFIVCEICNEAGWKINYRFENLQHIFTVLF